MDIEFQICKMKSLIDLFHKNKNTLNTTLHLKIVMMVMFGFMLCAL